MYVIMKDLYIGLKMQKDIQHNKNHTVSSGGISLAFISVSLSSIASSSGKKKK